MRSLLPSSAKRRWRRAPALLGAIALAMCALPASASARLPAEGPESLPEDYITEPEPLAAEFFEGEIVDHVGCVFALPMNKIGLAMQSDVWYTNKDGRMLPPRVGQVWYGVAHVGVGNPCAGGMFVEFLVTPPPNTTFAISPTEPIHCSFIPEGGNTWIDVTQDRSVCPTGVNGTANGWSLGGRTVASNNHFAIQFPLKSSAPLRGAAGPNGGDKLSVKVIPNNAITGDPFVHVDVEPQPKLKPISCDGTVGVLCGPAAE